MDDDLKPLFNKLTRLQKNYCLGLLEGLSQREAYYAAGGIAKSDPVADTCASELRSNPKVNEFMTVAEGKAVDDAIMTKNEALRALTKVANASIADLVNFATIDVIDAEGNKQKQTIWSLKDQSQLDRDQLALISELATTKDGFKFKMRSQDQAKKQLADLLGWNAPQKVANTDVDGNDQPSAIEMARTIVFALESAMGNKDTDSNSNSNGDDDE